MVKAVRDTPFPNTRSRLPFPKMTGRRRANGKNRILRSDIAGHLPTPAEGAFIGSATTRYEKMTKRPCWG